MKTNIRTLRKLADRLGFSVYTQGGTWILSSRETEPLHYSVADERAALLVGLNRAAERDLLSEKEQLQVASAICSKGA